MRRSRTGFTLIELLVVVSIIALLAALMLPALGRARQQSKATVCGTRLKGLGTAMHTYLAEFEYTFPLNGVIFPKPGGNAQNPTIGYGNGVKTANAPAPTPTEPNPRGWDLPYGALWPYMSQNRMSYICPGDELVRTYTGQLVRGEDGTISYVGGPAVVNAKGYWSYSINSVLNSEGQFRNNFFPLKASGPTKPWSDPLKSVTIARDADFIFFIEEEPTRSNFNDEVMDAPAYNGSDYLTGRHNNGGNVGFGDGHVEWFSEVQFNNVPQASGSTPNWDAMKSAYTRMFFPDSGAFTTPSN